MYYETWHVRFFLIYTYMDHKYTRMYMEKQRIQKEKKGTQPHQPIQDIKHIYTRCPALRTRGGEFMYMYIWPQRLCKVLYYMHFCTCAYLVTSKGDMGHMFSSTNTGWFEEDRHFITTTSLYFDLYRKCESIFIYVHTHAYTYTCTT